MKIWCGSGSAGPHLWLMDPDPAIFVSDLQDINQQKKFFLSSFYILLFEGTFTWFFKDKKSQRSHKKVPYESMFFLLFLLDDRSIRIRASDKWIRIREAQKHMDHTDPDPQHCLALRRIRPHPDQWVSLSLSVSFSISVSLTWAWPWPADRRCPDTLWWWGWCPAPPRPVRGRVEPSPRPTDSRCRRPAGRPGGSCRICRRSRPREGSCISPEI